VTLFGRFDVLNVFNWDNFVDYIPVYANGGVDVSYNRTGNITFVPRTFKFEVGLNF
jgi:hypothetical protein